MASVLPPVPSCLKIVQPYIKIAAEHDKRDPVIAYWCRLYAIQSGMKIDKSSKESREFLMTTMDWLEKVKKQYHDNDAITNEVVAQAHIENYALKLFLWADNEDRAARFNKNVVKAFYTAGIIFDILAVFGEYSEEISHHRKYSKWKATYIHNCLKNGEVPIPGPMAGDSELEEGAFGGFIQDSNEQPQPGSVYPPEIFPFPSLPSNNAPVSNPINLVTPSPGAHAPPSTPIGSSQPSPSSSGIAYIPPEATNGIVLQPEDFHKAQKYCKWAGSALQYEDVPTAIENLQKALLLLTTGSDE